VREGKDSPRSIPTSDFRAWWKVEMREDFHVWCIESGREEGKKKFLKIFISRKLTHGSTVSS
jgi:hypothetical protein